MKLNNSESQTTEVDVRVKIETAYAHLIDPKNVERCILYDDKIQNLSFNEQSSLFFVKTGTIKPRQIKSKGESKGEIKGEIKTIQNNKIIIIGTLVLTLTSTKTNFGITWTKITATLVQSKVAVAPSLATITTIKLVEENITNNMQQAFAESLSESTSTGISTPIAAETARTTSSEIISQSVSGISATPIGATISGATTMSSTHAITTSTIGAATISPTTATAMAISSKTVIASILVGMLVISGITGVYVADSTVFVDPVTSNEHMKSNLGSPRSSDENSDNEDNMNYAQPTNISSNTISKTESQIERQMPPNHTSETSSNYDSGLHLASNGNGLGNLDRSVGNFVPNFEKDSEQTENITTDGDLGNIFAANDLTSVMIVGSNQILMQEKTLGNVVPNFEKDSEQTENITTDGDLGPDIFTTTLNLDPNLDDNQIVSNNGLITGGNVFDNLNKNGGDIVPNFATNTEQPTGMITLEGFLNSEREVADGSKIDLKSNSDYRQTVNSQYDSALHLASNGNGLAGGNVYSNPDKNGGDIVPNFATNTEQPTGMITISGVKTSNQKLSDTEQSNNDLFNHNMKIAISNSKSNSIEKLNEEMSNSNTLYVDTPHSFGQSTRDTISDSVQNSNHDVIQNMKHSFAQNMGSNPIEISVSKLVDYYVQENGSIDNNPNSHGDVLDKIVYDLDHLSWSEQNYANMDLTISQGDPHIFTIGDTIEPCTNKMHPDQDDSYHWKFDLFVTDIPLKMDRTLCDGTYMMFVDFNSNGILDNGYEALWHPDYTTYEIMHIIDYEKGNSHDGKIDINDENIWNNVLVMDSDYKVHIPSKLGITGFDYIQEIGLGNDHYGPGVYSDCLYEGKNLYPNCKPVSDTHFRVISWNPQGLIFDDGTTKPTYGALQGPLLDCTIYDARYMIAEKQLSEWNLDEAMRLYEEGLAYCNSMEFTSEDPDKLLSHWVAGKASYYHRDGQLEEAKPLYEEALKMSPDRHFYLTDYALLLDQLGFDADTTLPIVERALEIDPNHGYAHTVKDRILSK